MAMDKTTIKVLNKLFEHGYRPEKAIDVYKRQV